MNNRFIKQLAIIASSILFVVSCSSDTDSFKTPNTSSTSDNNGIISQKNFTILFSEPRPKFFDVEKGTFSSTTVNVSVQIGDNNNQVITSAKTIRFRTEWGLIDPSCSTENGSCTVTWRSASPDDMPSNFRNNILAYALKGQESFDDLDGNGLFNDGDSFTDIEEPFVNTDETFITNTSTPSFTAGDIIVDTINGLDTTGADTIHNAGDGLFNGPNCSHSTLCSTTLINSSVWESGSLRLTGDTTSSVGGTVSGITGTLVLQNNGGNDLIITSDGEFAFSLSQTPGETYTVTIDSDTSGTCNIVSPTQSGIVVGDVTSIIVQC